MNIEIFADCECKRVHKSPIKNIVIGKDIIFNLTDELKKLKSKKVFVLTDENAYSAAGEKAVEILKSVGVPYSLYILKGDKISPDETSVGAAIMHFDNSCDTVIGIGSGVINDIGKILANISKCSYMILATAPSMDGYASATSSMERDGLKVSVPSKCPDIIMGDIDILKNAPVHMLKAGLGDMIAKYISICEWRISNLITGEYYCENIADMVRTALKKCIEHADGLLKRDEASVEAVFEGLIMCGLAMSYAGISRPASGVEHYLSHIWDMRGLEFKTPVELHGIQCAVGTLIAARIYEKIKTITPDREKALRFVRSFDFCDWSKELKEFLGKGADAMIKLEEKEQKYNKENHKKRLEKIIDNWDRIIKIIDEEVSSGEFIEDLLDSIDAPKSITDIGLPRDILPMTFKASKDIRDKYVLSRLCWDIGIIDEITDVK